MARDYLGGSPARNKSEAQMAIEKAKADAGQQTFQGHSQGGGTVKMPEGMTPEQEAAWRAGFKKGQAAVEGQDYGPGLAAEAGEYTAELLSPYGDYKSLEPYVGPVAAGVGAAALAGLAPKPVRTAAKGAIGKASRIFESKPDFDPRRIDSATPHDYTWTDADGNRLIREGDQYVPAPPPRTATGTTPPDAGVAVEPIWNHDFTRQNGSVRIQKKPIVMTPAERSAKIKLLPKEHRDLVDEARDLSDQINRAEGYGDGAPTEMYDAFGEVLEKLKRLGLHRLIE